MLEEGHPLIGTYKFIGEIRDKIVNYADRLDTLAESEWDRNQLPDPVKFALSTLAAELREVLPQVEACGRKVGEHIPAENFEGGERT